MCLIVHCKECGDIIPGANLTTRYCSNPECRKQTRRRYDAKKIGDRYCKTCGELIPPGSGRKLYCKEECARIAKRLRERKNKRTQKSKKSTVGAT